MPSKQAVAFSFALAFHVLRALRWPDSAVSALAGAAAAAVVAVVTDVVAAVVVVAIAAADVIDWGFVQVGSDHFFETT